AEAPPGAIGLELALPCLWQGLVMTEQLTALELWQALTVKPRQCFGLTDPHRHWLLFNPQTPWQVQASTLKTLGQNTPYLGQTLTGQVEAILQWDKTAQIPH
ncbi:MAG: dihydroorotase, partial [Microcystaceae cyanobacterium]